MTSTRGTTGVGPDQYRPRGLRLTIALCLSKLSVARTSGTTEGGGEDAHAARPAGQHSEFYPHLGSRKLHDVHALDMLLPEAGAIYVVDRGYVDFARLYVLHQAGAFFVHAVPRTNIDAHRVYSAPNRRIAQTGIICDQTISLDGVLHHVRITPIFCGASASRTPSPARRWSSSPTTSRFRPPPSARSTKPLAGGTLLQVDQAASSDQAVRTASSENAVKTQIWIRSCRLGLRPRRHRQDHQRLDPGRLALRLC